MWIADTPWPVIVLLVCAAAILMAVGTSKRRKGITIVAVLLLAIGGGAFLMDVLTVSDAEVVEERLHALTESFRQLDLENTLDYFSPQADKFRSQVTIAAALILEVNSMRITDVDVEMLAEGSRAKTHLRANGTATIREYGEQAYKTRWLLTWQREGDDWKVIDVDRLDLFTGESIPLLSRNR